MKETPECGVLIYCLFFRLILFTNRITGKIIIAKYPRAGVGVVGIVGVPVGPTKSFMKICINSRTNKPRVADVL
jgi:hypothetical protein